MTAGSNLSLRDRVGQALTMFVVAGLSISLLLYVAYSASQRTFEEFQIQKLARQGEILQESIQTYLRAGLPLRQFVGFTTLTEPVLTSDAAIARISMTDLEGNPVFEAGAPRKHSMKGTKVPAVGYDVRHWPDQIQVILPLGDRFETTGRLVITMNNSGISEKLNSLFAPVIQWACLVCVAFGALVFAFGKYLNGQGARRMGLAFATAYISVACIVVGSLVSLYSDGAHAKAEAVVAALGNRLDDAMIFGLDYNDFSGVNETLAEFLRLNPEIRDASVTTNGIVSYGSSMNRIGRRWASTEDSFNVVRLISPEAYQSVVKLIVEIPRSVIYESIGRSIKNFAALFAAAGIIAFLFLDVARNIPLVKHARKNSTPLLNPTGGAPEAALSLVKPAYFLAVFVENLSYAYLPQHFRAIAEREGLGPSFASAPMVSFFLLFAMALLPAGRLEKVIGARALLLAGLAICAASYGCMAAGPNLIVTTLLRGLAGAGQGCLFIGVQSYALRLSGSTGRTMAAGIIVFGYQAGMLSGMAIGSLLVPDIRIPGILVLGAVIALAAVAYTALVVPAFTPERAEHSVNTRSDMRAIRDMQFLRAIMLVGVPAKAIMTGVILFAVPITLAASGVLAEDIGQITMVYALFVLASNHYVRTFDGIRSIEILLLFGLILSCLGLLVIALGGWVDRIYLPWVVAAGVALIGIAHGCINAPVVSKVAVSPVALSLGATSVANTYRLLERVGHVLGAPIVALILQHTNGSAAAFLLLAAGTGGLALLFIASSNLVARREQSEGLTNGHFN